jgi:signal transduction histidine kinase
MIFDITNMSNNFRLGLIILFLNIFCKVMASEPIILEDKTNDKEYFFTGTAIDIFEDKTRNIRIEEIASPAFKNRFKPNGDEVPSNKNLNSAYWIRFTVINNSSRVKGWLMELYDFRIDSFEIYIPDGKGSFIVERGGDQYPFSNKKYNHKNFVFDLPMDLYQKTKPEIFYIRICSGSPIGIIGVIRTVNRFASYALMEYFVLAFFYGIIFSMLLYNLFLYFTINDVAYLFYVLYLLSFGTYAMSQDGTAFQLIWPDNPELNESINQYALLSIIICLLLYAKYFLLTKINSPFFNRSFQILIGFRLILFFIGFFFSPQILYKYISYFDTFCIIVAFAAGIDSYRKGYTPARYYNIAFAVFFLGYVVTIVDTWWLVGPTFIIVYSFNLGAAGEMILLSLALGDRIKTLIKEKQIAQNEIIVQLTEKEHLKDRINKELEQKVDERTFELREKNKQLDTFVYKASHDIKGPLKSVIGLTKVGMKDSKDMIAHEYFKHILKSTNRLDNLLTELLSMTKVQQAIVNRTPINFKELVNDILSSFENFEGYEQLKFKIYFEVKDEFLSDKQLLYSIIQNMIENSIKYRDERKQECYLDIRIETRGGKSKVKFSDNGLGIPKEMQEKIFDMFFKINENSNGTGLGLHMVKIALEKLGGKIHVESTPGEGSTFLIEL